MISHARFFVLGVVTMVFNSASPTVLVGASPTVATNRAVRLRPALVFTSADGRTHSGWDVLVVGNGIESVGPAANIHAPADAQTIDLPGTTLLPGLMDLHSRVGVTARSDRTIFFVKARTEADIWRLTWK